MAHEHVSGLTRARSRRPLAGAAVMDYSPASNDSYLDSNLAGPSTITCVRRDAQNR